MVKTIKEDIYVCEVCGKKFLNKGKCKEHEKKSPIKPKFGLEKEVLGHYPIHKTEKGEYAFTDFKVLDVKKKKHEFIYTLEPIAIGLYMGEGGYSDIICKKDGKWKCDNEEDKKIIKSLEGRLKEKVMLPESKLSHQIYYSL